MKKIFSKVLCGVLALACAFSMLWVYFRKFLSVERRLSKIEGEIDRIWNRIEWLCRDTDDRLSVDRLEFQQKSKQVRNLWTRLRHVEEALYIEPSDAFKDREEDGDDI